MSYFLFDLYSLNDSNNNIQFYMDNIQDESYYKEYYMHYQHNPEQIESYISEQITKPTLGNEKKNTNKIESENSKVNNNSQRMEELKKEVMSSKKKRKSESNRHT